MNIVMLTGFLGADPELKTLDSGSTVCNLSLATNQHWTDKAGEKQTRTDWHRLVAFGPLGETCVKYLNKGSQVAVRGEIRCNNWEDSNGNTQRSVEIIARNVEFLDRKPTSNASAEVPF